MTAEGATDGQDDRYLSIVQEAAIYRVKLSDEILSTCNDFHWYKSIPSPNMLRKITKCCYLQYEIVVTFVPCYVHIRNFILYNNISGKKWEVLREVKADNAFNGG